MLAAIVLMATADVIALGQLEGQAPRLAGRLGVIVAAPHGGYDAHTVELARALSRRLGAGVVTASGFRTPEHPLNVNRPTEGIPPLTEAETARARRLYAAWRAEVHRAAGGLPVRLYVEIHGNGRAETARRIEVATVGVDAATAARLKRVFARARDRLGARAGELERLDLWIEPLDKLVWSAGNTKRRGILRNVRRALHVELPRAARDTAAARKQVLTLLLAVIREVMPPAQPNRARQRSVLSVKRLRAEETP